MKKKGYWILFVVAGVIVLVDQITKYIVSSKMALYASWTPFPWLSNIFHIHYVNNTGAAFGLFDNSNLILIGVAILVSVLILVYYHSLDEGFPWVRLSMGLQLGGALGNLIDRILVGSVIDFLDFHFWPVFNVADSSIVCGVILMVGLLLFQDFKERQSVAANGELEESA